MAESKSSVLVVDDDEAVGKVLSALLAQAGYPATWVSSGEAAIATLRKQSFDLVISDVRMPGMDGVELLAKLKQEVPELPVVLLTAHGTVPMAVDAMRRGAADFLQKPFERDEILFVVKKSLDASAPERSAAPRRAASSALDELVGTSPAMDEVRRLVQRAATSAATVLVRGESGTGKELVARALHALSPRAKGPFVRLNCGALVDSLLESELFGHEKGAFTGAVQRKPGRVELAEGGTLFLDEVGDVTPAMQVKLLRLLQEKEFERVGGTQTLKADVRFVAATHQPLEERVRAGAFREDLFYRLNVVPLFLPPLRARADDVAQLAKHFVAQLSKQHGRRVSLEPDAVAALRQHAWPGNVRELQNLLERLVVLNETDEVTAADVQRELGRSLASPPAPTPPVGAAANTLSEQRAGLEREAVKQALDKAKGNRTLAARLLGVSRRTLYNKLDALGLADA
ncbi:MAG: sigma-54 dependent transcriptional regulator [Myxococcota bacterium]|jgi:DNA-binding NtrC family response regulator